MMINEKRVVVFPRSAATRIQPGILTVTPEQAARYAGGGSFRIKGSMKAVVAAAVDEAKRLIAPAFAEAVHPVTSSSPDGRLFLENGSSLSPPLHERYPQPSYLAAVVCTIGPSLEKACGDLAREGDSLMALFLNAAGTAALDALSDVTYARISDTARLEGFSSGCRFAPGYFDMPMSDQLILFGLVDGESIGVHLNERMVMRPGKSLSFFVVLSRGELPMRQRHKCAVCQLKECRFRLARK